MATFDQQRQQVDTQYNADTIIVGGDAATLRALLGRAQPTEDDLALARRRLAELPLQEIPKPALLPPGSRIVLRRNDLFVGRAADLRELARMLKGGEAAAIGQTAVTSGLGGIGKTQLASEFVHRYGQFFLGGSYWLSFANPDPIAAEIATCGGRTAMDLPNFGGSAQVFRTKMTGRFDSAELALQSGHLARRASSPLSRTGASSPRSGSRPSCNTRRRAASATPGAGRRACVVGQRASCRLCHRRADLCRRRFQRDDHLRKLSRVYTLRYRTSQDLLRKVSS